MKLSKHHQIPILMLLVFALGTAAVVSQDILENRLFSEFTKKTNWIPADNPKILMGRDLLELREDVGEYLVEYKIEKGYRALYLAGEDSIPLTITIYQAPSQINAFGFYSTDKSPSQRFFDIGFEAFLAGRKIKCWYGRFTIVSEISDSLEAGEQYMEEAVRQTVRLLPRQKRETPILDSFAEKDRVEHSEKYYVRRWLNMEYFRNIYYADYYIPQGYSRIFIINNSTTAAADSNFWKYYAFLKKRNRILSEKLQMDTDYFVSDDPLWGKTLLTKKNQIIYGILDYRDKHWTENRLREILERLKKRKIVKSG